MTVFDIFNYTKKNFTSDLKKKIDNFIYQSFNSKGFLKKYSVFKSTFSNQNSTDLENQKSLYAFGLHLANYKYLEEAYLLFKFLLKNKPIFCDEIYLNISKIMHLYSKNHLAIFYIKKIEEKNKNNPEINYNLGLAHQRMGSISKAKMYFKETLKLNPNFVEAHRLFGLSHKYSSDKEEQLQLMIKILNNEDVKLTNNQKSQLLFTIGKAYDDLKDYKQAFNFIQQANKFRRREIKYSEQLVKEQFNVMKNVLLKINKKILLKNEIKKKAIYIVGMPRSGTTLLEQIISSHSKIKSFGEPVHIPNTIKKFFPERDLNKFEKSFDDLTLKKVEKVSEYLDDLYNLDNKKYIAFTDKLPFNFIFIGLINSFLPNAKIVHIKRSPQDTCVSILKNYFQGEFIGFAYDEKEIASYYNCYLDLMDFWKKNNCNFYEVKYENLVTNLEQEVRKIFNYLNIDFEDQCLNFHNNNNSVSSLSIAQVRKKNYTSSIDNWKNYKKFLSEAIINIQ